MNKSMILCALAATTILSTLVSQAGAHASHTHHLHIEEVAQAWYQTITIPALGLGVAIAIGVAAYLALRPARRRRVNPSGDAS